MFPDELAEKLATALGRYEHRIVFAESCTAGLISASLARIPGVSSVLSGSAVVYQVDTKAAWLGCDRSVIQRCGVVSEEVSRQMAVGVLNNSRHATVSVSVTGHLGPDAPEDLNGVAWTCVCCRVGFQLRSATKKLTLQTEGESERTLIETRRFRQFEAVRQVMEFTLHCIQHPDQLSTR